MHPYERWIWAVAIVLVDLLIFAVPLTALAAAYILIQRPRGFKAWVDKLYTENP